MSSFSRESFISRLRDLTTAQQAIQTLSLWCLHHRKHSNVVVSIWRDEFQQCVPSRRIVLLYLANDIIQNSRKKGPEFRLSFQTVLKEAIRLASKTDSKTYTATQRLLDVWEERGVFDEDYLRMLKAVHVEPRSQPGSVEQLLVGPPIDDSGNSTSSTASQKISLNRQNSVEPKVSPPSNQSRTSPSVSASQSSRETFLPLALRDLESDVEMSGELTLAQALECPPQPDELIDALVSVTNNNASADKDTRELIAAIPHEVSDHKELNQRLRHKRDAHQLLEKAKSASEMVEVYSARLKAEQAGRRKLAVRLRAFLVQQRNLLLRDIQMMEDSRGRLAKVTTVRSELLKHLSNLPDLSRLPDLARLAPLPAPNDLFR